MLHENRAIPFYLINEWLTFKKYRLLDLTHSLQETPSKNSKS